MKITLAKRNALPVILCGSFLIISGLISYTRNHQTDILALNLILAGLSLLVGLSINRTAMKDLSKRLTSLTSLMETLSREVHNIAESSEEIAQSASEQAASLEETTATLEEISSMTDRNAENSDQADGLMQENQTTISRAEYTMKEMISSMGSIAESGRETRKIIKTIDEIAFQTNLLALNAAVEAARAGEAGAGFAVVADEVRNLAMRAAEAAKNTSSLIDETVKKIEDGTTLVENTEEAFASVSEGSNKIAGLISEIAGASREQNTGIRQLNSTIAAMDKTVQINAGHTDNNCHSAKEMEKTAYELKEAVRELLDLLGSKKMSEIKSRTKKSAPAKKKHAPGLTGRQKNGASRTNAESKKDEAVKTLPDPTMSGSDMLDKLSPEDIIPFDEDEFEDF